MEDHECYELLRLLHKYVTTYTPDIPQTISDLSADLVASNAEEVTAERMLAWHSEIVTTPGVT